MNTALIGLIDRLINILLATIFILFSCFIGWAQQNKIQFEQLTIDQGLSGNSIYDIVEDQQGFIWIATANGLNRYDGYKFLVYKNIVDDASSLSNNQVYALCYDHRGRLWVGTHNGLNLFDEHTGKFTRYMHDAAQPNSISNDAINVIIEDHNGIIWIGTENGLNCYNSLTNQFINYSDSSPPPFQLSNNVINALYEDQHGTLWVGTSNGLVALDATRKQVTTYYHNALPTSLPGNNITAIAGGSKGHLWVGTQDKGFGEFDYKERRFISYQYDKNNSFLNNSKVNAILEDDQGIVWIGCVEGGLNRFDPITQQFTNFRTNQANLISSNTVRTLYQDRQRTLWVGTFGGGLNRYNTLTTRFYVYANDLTPGIKSNSSVATIHQDHRGMLWVGTFGEGLNRYDEDTQAITNYQYKPNDKQSISGNTVRAICEDRKGRLWMGVFGGGLNRFDPATNSFYRYRYNPLQTNSLSSDFVRIIYEDHNGILWIGTNGGGLNRFDAETESFTAYRNRPNDTTSINSDEINAICDDINGTLWVGTHNGLSRFDAGHQQFQHLAAIIPNVPTNLKDVSFITRDREATLWIGTFGNGLFRLTITREKAVSITSMPGFANDSITGILCDDNGKLWVSTLDGLCSYDIKQSKLKRYHTSDGLQSNAFNSGVCFKNDQGELFFGGINGFNRFFPDDIPDNSFIPPIVITEFKINNQPDSRINLPEYRLNYHENTVSFEFAALNFIHSEKNQYAYQLEGFEPDWVYCGERRYANYTKLPAGEYIFRVRGSNNDGRWNEQGLAIKIIILSPLWQRWWAYLGYLILIGATIYGGVQVRLHTLKRRNELLEAGIIARTTEINEKVEQLLVAKHQVEERNEELQRKNEELALSYRRTEIVFSALSEVLPGTVLVQKYRLEQKIGAGGFGIVYRATHLALNRAVAIKILQPRLSSTEIESIERFHTEALSACRINSKHAVTVFDFGITPEGISYLVMELLQGCTLNELLHREERLTITRCAQILTGICAALDCAHQAGIVHRDIKPDNIFLHITEEGEEIVKVVDFGIAKLLIGAEELNLQSLTHTGAMVGTPSYMAPERFNNSPCDGRTDVYSLGVLLYRMLTGRLPFEVPNGDIVLMAMMHRTEKPPSLRIFDASIPIEIEEVVLQALAKEAHLRPTARQLADNFRQAANKNSLIPANLS